MGILENVLKGTTVGEQAAKLDRVTPITQAGAMTTGATNPDSVKMTGTPNQKMAAMQDALRRSTDVESSIIGTKIRQPKLTASQEEKARQEKATRLKQFGDAEDRLAATVQRNATQAIETEAIKESSSSLTVNKLSPALVADPTLAADLEALKKDPANVNILSTIQSKLKRTDMTVQDIFSEFFKEDPASSAASLVKALPSSAKMGLLDDSDWQALGFDSTSDAASTLGVSEAVLKDMDLKVFQEKVTTLRDQGYSTTTDIQTKMADPSIGAATRQALNQELIDRGVVGARAADELVGDLDAQVANGNKVSIGGSVVTIEDMLSDEKMQTVLSDILEDDTALQTLPDTDPFKKWFTSNKDALAKWKTSLGDTITKISDNRKSWDSLRTVPGTEITLNDSTMEALLGNQWNPSGAVSAPSALPPIFAVLKNPAISPEDKAGLIQAVDKFSSLGSAGLVDMIRNVDTNSLPRIKAALADPGKIEEIAKRVSIQKAIASDYSPEAVQNMVYGISDVTKQIPKDLSSTEAFRKEFPILSNLNYGYAQANAVISNYFKSGQAAKDLSSAAASVLSGTPESMLISGSIPKLPDPMQVLRTNISKLLAPINKQGMEKQAKEQAAAQEKTSKLQEKTKADVAKRDASRAKEKAKAEEARKKKEAEEKKRMQEEEAASRKRDQENRESNRRR